MPIHLNLPLTHLKIETFSKLLVTFVSHVSGKGTACFLHECEVLHIFMCAKEHLPCVQLSEDAGHGPDVTLHVPLLAVQDDLRRPILTRIHYLRVVLVLIGRATEVY